MFNIIHMETEKRSSNDFKIETQMPINGRMNTENVAYTYNGILWDLKKEGITAIFNNMD